ncbi:ATPase, BadF/BadG/BcrA/BcrD type [Mycobacteroides abscessus]|uniref:BadF/BadG/BcrA/BcrD type ATPase n=1 Tax=Mycobacteroides abscessus subsp. bolletii 50594 TaxID=1303024 RepID=A0AB33A5E6_9MYCO|nr:BadF/BadG/BcrA/BcrD ATPase family protein [Mycobacteroides abscessus]AGM26962.1 BadF/BadG/BcrA/BcrD type ATPase [Mycobacteroides abscessus subsp. bolletii 50594]BBZ83146.1 ATPase, BadF/BadG/BcrA/BcrD type [Mycobacteroides abscessus]
MARDVKLGVTVGIDIGGSKTRAVAVAGGRVIDDALAGSANLQSVTEEQAKAVFADIFSRLNRSDISRVSAGSAGVDTAEGAQTLIRLLRPYAPDAEITAVHDTQLVLAAGGLTAGIAVISGTGSVAWGKRADGAVARVGGWGYLLGDDGSGYGVSRSAVRHALSLSDRGDPPDALSRKFAAECGVTEPAQLLDHFYAHSERRYWAKMAGLVFDLAATGDKAAQVITKQTAIDLAALIEGVCLRLGPGLPVVLGGGLLVNQPGLVADIIERTRTSGVSDIAVLQREPVFGALALAGVDVEGLENA